MSIPRFAPKRPLLHEILALAPIAILAAAAVLGFPREVFSFRGGMAPGGDSPASCAFATMDAASAAKARDMIRSALSTGADTVRNLRADLSLSTAEEAKPGAIIDMSERLRPAAPSAVRWRKAPLPPSLAAPPPRFDGEAAGAQAALPLPFPRGALLENPFDTERNNTQPGESAK